MRLNPLPRASQNDRDEVRKASKRSKEKGKEIVKELRRVPAFNQQMKFEISALSTSEPV
jgi:hypothetical protein